MESTSALELLSRAALNVQEHEVAIELSKLPAKKRLTQYKAHQQHHQNAILNSTPPTQSSLSSNLNQSPLYSTVSTTSTTTGAAAAAINNNNSIKSSSSTTQIVEPMEQDDEDEEINVHDDDSPLDMRITKHDSDSEVHRPSVIRRAPSFKETNSNSPSDSSSIDPFIDEHFRRSLGTDYDLIMRNKQLEQEQKQRMIEEQILLQQQQQQVAALQAQQQNILKLKHHKKHQIHQHHQAMLSIQQENQLPQIHQPTPIPIQIQQIIPNAPQSTTIQSHQQQQQQQVSQKQVIITEHSDADEMSVDDHFAKALGDTWKKIQNENK